MNERNVKINLFLLLIVSYMYFFHPVLYDNQLTRLDLVCSAVTRGVTNIDPYASNTIDKAIFKGHAYCDKAPGLSLVAIPLAEAIRPVAVRDGQFTLCEPDGMKLLHFVLSLLLLGIPTALAALLLFGILRRIGAGSSGAFLLSVTWGIGTNAFTYATHFYDHQFTAVLTLIALFLIRRGRDDEKDYSPGLLMLIGFLLAYAAISEYPSALTGAVLGIYLIGRMKKKYGIFWVALGGAAPLALLAYYNYVSFGSALSLGYFHEAYPYFNEQMSKGIGGVTYPHAHSFFSILFSPERGLFWGAPFLLAAVPGFVYLIRRDRALGWTCLAAATARVLVNSSYYEYMGGYTPGPRFLVPALPFALIAVGAYWRQASPRVRLIVAGLCVGSIAIQTALNSVEPHAPLVFASPGVQYGLNLMMLGYRPSNALAAAGLPIAVSLVFLPVIIMLCLAIIYFKFAPREGRLIRITAPIVIAALVVGIYLTVGVIQMRGDNYMTHFYTGVAMSRNGRPDVAVNEFKKTVKVKPKFSSAFYNLGTAYIKLARYKDAESTFQKSYELEPGNFQYLLSWSASQMLAGDTAAARINCGRALILQPGNPLAERLCMSLGVGK